MTVDVDPNAAANAKKMTDAVGKAHDEATRRARQAAEEQRKIDEERVKRFQDTYDKLISKVDDLGKSQLKASQQNTKMIQDMIDSSQKYGDAMTGELRKISAHMSRNEEHYTKFLAKEIKRRETMQTDSMERLINQHESAQNRMQNAERVRAEGLASMGRGVASMVESLAMMGVLSEDNTEALLRQVIVVKTLSTAAQGALDIYKGWHKAMVAYESAVKAAAVAEAALASARAASAAAGGATFKSDGFGGVVQVGGAAAANQGAAALAPAISGLTVSAMALPAAIAAALAGTVGAIAMATNAGGFRDWAANQMGKAGIGDPDSWSGWAIGMSSYSGITGVIEGIGGIESTASLQRNAFAEREQAERMQAQRQAGLDQFARHDGAAQDQFEIQRQIRQRNQANQAMIASMADPETRQAMTYQQLEQAMNRMQQTRQMIAGADAMNPGMMQHAEQQRAQQAQIEAIEHVIALRKQALSLEQQASQESMRAAQAETRELENQLAIEKQKFDQAEQRLMSAKERFGSLDEATQRQTISAMQKARQGQDLSREERSLLRAVGTEQAGGYARSGDLAAADAAGFDQFFGSGERQQMQSATAEQSRLKLEVEAKRALEVKITTDIDALTKNVMDAVEGLLDEQDELIEQKLRRWGEERGNQRNNLARGNPPGA